MQAFEKDTFHRMLVEAARYWIVSTFLETKKIPAKPAIYFAYPNGPASMEWGDSGCGDDEYRPLKGKRVRITVEIEDHE